ncbi:uncharacterized protein BDZ99DRAFT_561320 [Mytilinidion resinicola]|uniref:Gfd2/YDR514C-like C-terminal domain-containing protein n=1 Tax=Mytilinidion resinicola TaxID=574789 RepID=A0A6A6YS11_9PEZI|nr:uncharacterized protein BDZ99DRAFT_561320 [Mytilinidion resinicola]KAF2810834.1 hypothetical protein BDZ99DRAFT_561320 [Mytilinidion resinicola]
MTTTSINSVRPINTTNHVDGNSNTVGNITVGDVTGANVTFHITINRSNIEDQPPPGTEAVVRLQNELKKLHSLHMMQHALGSPIENAPGEFQDYVINSIDCEEFEYNPHRMTEVGVAVLDTRDIRGKAPGEQCKNWLEHVWFYHFRICETGHLVNKNHCKGNPNGFDFGKSLWVKMEHVKDILVELFSVPVAGVEHERVPGEPLRPVILLGHALQNDLKILKKNVGFDPTELGTMAATIDTQHIVREHGIRNSKTGSLRDWINLGDLINQLGGSGRDLHNAGNDAAYTMIAGILMGVVPFPALPATLPEKEASAYCVEVQNTFQHTKNVAATQHSPPWGLRVFCTRCESTTHLAEDCRAHVACSKCKHAGKKFWRSHSTSRCARNDI